MIDQHPEKYTDAELDALALVHTGVSVQSFAADSCECNDCEDSPAD